MQTYSASIKKIYELCPTFLFTFFHEFFQVFFHGFSPGFIPRVPRLCSEVTSWIRLGISPAICSGFLHFSISPMILQRKVQTTSFAIPPGMSTRIPPGFFSPLINIFSNFSEDFSEKILRFFPATISGAFQDSFQTLLQHEFPWHFLRRFV